MASCPLYGTLSQQGLIKCYNGAQWYEQFLQVGWLNWALILLGLALCLPSTSVSSVFMVVKIITLFTSDRGGAICFLPVSVCLLARLLKNTSMDLDEILHVDRCRDMDKPINF